MNKKIRKTALLMGVMTLLGLGYSSNAYAAGDVQNVQQATKKITGTVVDAQGPVIGASVMEKGTTNGTVTDFDGTVQLLTLTVTSLSMFIPVQRSLSRTSVMRLRKSL